MAARRKRFTAQSLVEFAFVAPIFFLLVFGLIEGGRLVWTYNTLTNATKEGTRYAIVHGSRADTQATDASVKEHMLNNSTGLSGGNLTVIVDWEDTDNDGDDDDGDDGDNDPGDKVQIDATYRHTFIVGYIFGSAPIDLEASSEAMVAY